MPNPTDTFLSGSNIDFIEGLYARWLEDPSSVDPSWRELFAGTRTDGHPLLGSGDGRAQPTNGHGAGNGSAVAARSVNGGNGAAVTSAPARGQLVSVGDVPAALAAMQLQARVDQTMYAFRLRGHLLAQLDPLGRPRPPLDHIADLAMVSDSALHSGGAGAAGGQLPTSSPTARVRLKDLLARLRRTYCGHHRRRVHAPARQRAPPLADAADGAHREPRPELSVEEQRRILDQALLRGGLRDLPPHQVRRAPSASALDGGESLMPMLDTLLEVGGELGVEEVVIGMAHRGRLNVLTNILGKSPDQIFSEFEGPADPRKSHGPRRREVPHGLLVRRTPRRPASAST